MITKLKRLFAFLPNLKLLPFFHEEYLNDLKSPKILMGKILANQISQKKVNVISDTEFKVFSQWGDDGIIQYLINNIEIPHKTFIEFGVENYREANTRYLLINDKWSGFVIDGSRENIEYIKKDVVSWACNLHTCNAFITKENINELISRFLHKGYSSEIGLLSMDIDGNDYWVWNEINVINPVIIIAEYNAAYGAEKAWTIPYKADFYRMNEDATLQYWGASLNAFCQLAEKKGYYFIGCNSNGNNAYFVRKDKIADLKPLTASMGFVDASFREYVDEHGERVHGSKRLELIKGKKMFNVETNQIDIID